MKLLMYSIFLLVIAPCNSSKNVVKTPAEIDKTSKVTIIYQTTPCFGRCPLYTLTINGETKTATFIGDKHTEKIGTYTKAISKSELEVFVKAFERSEEH